MDYIPALIGLVIAVFMVIALWKIYVKAGEPGWACLIPIYNIIVLMKIIGKPAWWIILFFIPIANFVISIIVYLELAKVFGKGAGFGVGMLLLPFVFFPILGFGDATYTAPTPA